MSIVTGHLPAASNRADLMFQVQLHDPVTNDFVDFTNTLITVALRQFAKSTPAISGTNQDGHVTLLGPSAFEVRFTRTEMSQFGRGDLDMGITVRLTDGITYQLFAGQIPIVDGVVSS